jgi:hypothetical protein
MSTKRTPVAISGRGGLWAVMLGVAAALACVVPAQATVYEHFHYADSEGPVPDEICGITVTRTSVFSGNVVTRTGKHELTSAFFGMDNYRYVDTFTNPATGRSFTISGNGMIRDVKAVHVEGTIFQFVTIETGQPFVIRDDSGQVVVRDRGSIRTTYTFDTGGDAVPGGTFLDLIDVQVNGPHPGFFFDDATFCATVVPLLT